MVQKGPHNRLKRAEVIDNQRFKMLAITQKSATMLGNRNKANVSTHPRRQTAKPHQGTMTYYQNLLKQIAQARKQHPRSTVIMNADTFKIEASARNIAALRKKMNESSRSVGFTSVIVGSACTHQLTMLGGK